MIFSFSTCLSFFRSFLLFSLLQDRRLCLLQHPSRQERRQQQEPIQVVPVCRQPRRLHRGCRSRRRRCCSRHGKAHSHNRNSVNGLTGTVVYSAAWRLLWTGCITAEESKIYQQPRQIRAKNNRRETRTDENRNLLRQHSIRMDCISFDSNPTLR